MILPMSAPGASSTTIASFCLAYALYVLPDLWVSFAVIAMSSPALTCAGPLAVILVLAFAAFFATCGLGACQLWAAGVSTGAAWAAGAPATSPAVRAAAAMAWVMRTVLLVVGCRALGVAGSAASTYAGSTAGEALSNYF